MLRKAKIRIILALLALLMLGSTAFAAPTSQLIKDGDVHTFPTELSNMYITQHNVGQNGGSIYKDSEASLDMAVRLMADLSLEAYGVNGALATQFLYGDVDFADIRVGYMADLYQVFYYDSTSYAQVIYIQYYPQMKTAWYGLIDVIPQTQSACQAIILDRTNAAYTASRQADAAGLRRAYELLADELAEAYAPVEVSCSRCAGTGWVTETCPECHGAGTRSVNCGTCGGDGQRNCSYCGGAGRKACDNCHGDGIGNCNRCLGCGTTGGTTCRKCGGSGLGECPFCEGSGTEYCTPTYRCKHCNSGKISATCGNCSGSGETYAGCPECAGTGKVTQSGRLTMPGATPSSTTTADSRASKQQEAVDYSAQILQAQTYSRRIAAGMFHTLGIQADGTVYGAGNPNMNRTKFSDCKNVVQVAAGEDFGVCLRADGTVLARGENSSGECRTSAWRNIVDIAAGGDHLVGLKKDGTVVATGWNGNGECDVSSWFDIIAVEANYYCSAGLKRDGTVVMTGSYYPDAAQWRDIVSIAVGTNHIVGLQSNGTLLVNKSFSGDVQHPAEAWTGIIDIACYTPPEERVFISGESGYVKFDYVVGLRADGTIMAESLTENLDPAFSQTVSQWKDIVAIEGGTNLIGITSDGRVLTAGPDIYDWTWNREAFTYPPSGNGRNTVGNWDLID